MGIIGLCEEAAYYGVALVLVGTIGLVFYSTALGFSEIAEAGALRTTITILERVLLIFILVRQLEARPFFAADLSHARPAPPSGTGMATGPRPTMLAALDVPSTPGAGRPFSRRHGLRSVARRDARLPRSVSLPQSVPGAGHTRSAPRV